MKKLNATNAIVILSLGLTLSVVVAGCGGNDSAELAVTKNVVSQADLNGTDGGAGGGTTKPDTKTGSSDSGAGGGTTKPDTKTGSSDSGAGGGATTSDTKTGSSDSGAGGGSTTSDTKTGISDGGTGKSATVSNMDLIKKSFGPNADYSDLTPAQINSFTSEQWSQYVNSGLFSASQVAAFPTKIIKNLSAAALMDLSTEATQALTKEQLNSMSKDQLNALISPSDGSAMELTDAQLETVNARLKNLK